MAEPAQLAIRSKFARPSADDIAPFLKAPTGWVVDAQGRRGALPHWIRPLSRQTRFVGVAMTVRTRPVDNLAPYAALKYAKPGDVLVVAADGGCSASVIGDILLGMAKNAGMVGGRHRQRRARYRRHQSGRYSDVRARPVAQFSVQGRTR